MTTVYPYLDDLRIALRRARDHYLILIGYDNRARATELEDARTEYLILTAAWTAAGMTERD